MASPGGGVTCRWWNDRHRLWNTVPAEFNHWCTELAADVTDVPFCNEYKLSTLLSIPGVF